MGMFCYQCQEALKGTGCNVKRRCSKRKRFKLQDLLVIRLRAFQTS